MKNVQIPYELFVSLLRYHLMEDDDCLNEIRQGLEQKLDSLVRHELYAKYKTAPTQEERENARQEYLEKRGSAARGRSLRRCLRRRSPRRPPSSSPRH